MPPTARPLLPTRGSRLNRRTLLFLGITLLILLGGVVGGVAFLPLSRSSPGNYPMFGFDPAHTHFNTQEHTLTPANVSKHCRKPIPQILHHPPCHLLAPSIASLV